MSCSKKKLNLILLLSMVALCSSNRIIGKPFEIKMANLKVTVFCSSASKNDTLCLGIIDEFFRGSGQNKLLKVNKSVIDPEGHFHFSIPVNRDGYFQIYLVNSKDSLFIRQGIYEPLTPVYFYEMGDSININIEKKGSHSMFFYLPMMYNYSFSGKGSEKLKLNQQVDSLLGNMDISNKIRGFDSNMVYHSPLSGQRVEAGYNYLKKHKQGISSVAYWVLQADLIYNHSYGIFSTIRDQLFKKSSISHNENTLIDTINLFAALKRRYFQQLNSAFSIYQIPEFALTRSKNYLEFAFLRIASDCLVKYGIASPIKIFDWIVKNYKGEIRDRLLTYYFMNYYNDSDLKRQITEAKAIIKSSYCREELAKIEGRINGRPAYNFSLSDINGNTIHLNDFKEKIVLMDFWFTGCGGCASFYNDILSKVEKKFANDSNVVFLSISLDKFERWKKGLKSGIYTSNKAINLYTNNKGMASPIIKYYRVVAYPTFIIIKNGRIMEYNPFLKNEIELVDVINNLKTE